MEHMPEMTQLCPVSESDYYDIFWSCERLRLSNRVGHRTVLDVSDLEGVTDRLRTGAHAAVGPARSAPTQAAELGAIPNNTTGYPIQERSTKAPACQHLPHQSQASAAVEKARTAAMAQKEAIVTAAGLHVPEQKVQSTLDVHMPGLRTPSQRTYKHLPNSAADAWLQPECHAFYSQGYSSPRHQQPCSHSQSHAAAMAVSSNESWTAQGCTPGSQNGISTATAPLAGAMQHQHHMWEREKHSNSRASQQLHSGRTNPHSGRAALPPHMHASASPTRHQHRSPTRHTSGPQDEGQRSTQATRAPAQLPCGTPACQGHFAAIAAMEHPDVLLHGTPSEACRLRSHGCAGGPCAVALMTTAPIHAVPGGEQPGAHTESPCSHAVRHSAAGRVPLHSMSLPPNELTREVEGMASPGTTASQADATQDRLTVQHHAWCGGIGGYGGLHAPPSTGAPLLSAQHVYASAHDCGRRAVRSRTEQAGGQVEGGWRGTGSSGVMMFGREEFLESSRQLQEAAWELDRELDARNLMVEAGFAHCSTG
eukprot:jgi/Ulvmu1/9528/UM053_0017.1